LLSFSAGRGGIPKVTSEATANELQVKGPLVSAIAVENVSKHWTTASGEVRAVDSVSFALEPGTLNVLLGPSGCGKSTTLRLIAGLDHADTGRVWIDGRDVTHLPPARRKISMVFQSYALFPHLNVSENIIFGLRVRKTEHADRDRRLKRVSELLGLSALLDRKPGQLSGGQQQRVALGRALIAEAPVCLMDEPLSNLDAQLRQEMRLEIRNLQRQLGITMVYVTHDQVEAMSMADRVILLSGGRIEQNGAPVDLYETPANTLVARFIGTPPMNLLRLGRAGGEAVVAGTEGPGIGPLEWAGGTLGVRPEHVVLARDGAFAVRVESVEYLGADSLLICRIGDQLLTARVAGRVGVSGGDSARLGWARGASHFFDAATGTRRSAEPIHQGATMFA
jgi:sn-glycerol 3-phosphate transport system ATP-binding protein